MNTDLDVSPPQKHTRKVCNKSYMKRGPNLSWNIPCTNSEYKIIPSKCPKRWLGSQPDKKMWREGEKRCFLNQSVERRRWNPGLNQTQQNSGLLPSFKAVTFLWYVYFAMQQCCKHPVGSASWQTILPKSMVLAEYLHSCLLERGTRHQPSAVKDSLSACRCSAQWQLWSSPRPQAWQANKTATQEKYYSTRTLRSGCVWMKTSTWLSKITAHTLCFNLSKLSLDTTEAAFSLCLPGHMPRNTKACLEFAYNFRLC